MMRSGTVLSVGYLYFQWSWLGVKYLMVCFSVSGSEVRVLSGQFSGPFPPAQSHRGHSHRPLPFLVSLVLLVRVRRFQVITRPVYKPQTQFLCLEFNKIFVHRQPLFFSHYVRNMHISRSKVTNETDCPCVCQAAEGQPAGQSVQRSLSAPSGCSALLRWSRSPGRVRPTVLARLCPHQGGPESQRRHTV